MAQSQKTAGFFVFIPDYFISFSDSILRFSSSFTSEGYALFQALHFIQNFPSEKYLIASDSRSILYSIMPNPFNSHICPLSLCIRSQITYLESYAYTINFLWRPSHVGIVGNEITNSLAKATVNFHSTNLLNEIPFTDFLLHLHSIILNAWKADWSSHTASAKWYKTIVTEIPRLLWFLNSNLSRSHIISFIRLRLGHNLLPACSFCLVLNSSPLGPRHSSPDIRDFSHLLFH